MKESIKKLQLKKEVVAKLTKNEMKSIFGGEQLTTNPVSCGANCHSSSKLCVAQNPSFVYTRQPYPFSFPKDPTNDTCNGAKTCGTDSMTGCS